MTRAMAHGKRDLDKHKTGKCKCKCQLVIDRRRLQLNLTADCIDVEDAEVTKPGKEKMDKLNLTFDFDRQWGQT